MPGGLFYLNSLDRFISYISGRDVWLGFISTMFYRSLFVCIEVLRPSQPNGVMSSAVSLPNHTFSEQAKSSKRQTSSVHILSPESDNCPS